MSDDELDEEIAKFTNYAENEVVTAMEPVDKTDSDTVTTFIAVEPIHRPSSVDLLISEIENELLKLNGSPERKEVPEKPRLESQKKMEHDERKTITFETIVDDKTAVEDPIKSVTLIDKEKSTSPEMAKVTYRSRSRSRSRSPDEKSKQTNFNYFKRKC